MQERENSRSGSRSSRTAVSGGKSSERSVTRSSEVYETLRDEIVRGQLRPSERLVEHDLAERLNVSRTPIREALQMLARDGLIISRRRGWVVYEFSLPEIRHLSEVRAALEGYAAGLAARNATAEEVDQLETAYQEDAKQVEIDRRRIVEVNNRFHNAVNRLSANPVLVEMIQNTRRYYFNVQVATLYTDEELWRSMSDHDFIIAALRRGDSETAERVSRRHVEDFLHVVENRLYHQLV